MYVCMSVLAIPICGLKQDKAFPRKVSPVPELKALAHWDQSKVLKCDCESVKDLSTWEVSITLLHYSKIAVDETRVGWDDEANSRVNIRQAYK